MDFVWFGLDPQWFCIDFDRFGVDFNVLALIMIGLVGILQCFYLICIGSV